MKLEEYKAKRTTLLAEAQKLINEGKAKEFETKEQEIKALDESFETMAKQQANKNAIDGNNGAIPIALQTNSRSGEMENKVILNKNDKWADRIANDENKRLDIGKWFKGVTTGDWKGATNEFQNLTTTSTGVLVPQMLSGRIIDAARAKSLFTSAGVPVVPMETNNLTFAKVKTDPLLKFKGEGQEATESSMELEGVELKSKTIYGYAYITLEAIRSSKNLEDVLISTFSQALAQAIDSGFLYGQDDGQGGFDNFAPDGILNDAGINSITATTTTNYDDIIKAISKVKQANGMPKIWGMNAKSQELYSLLKDQEQRYLMPPSAVEGLEQIISNQLLHDETDGSTSLVFDPEALIIGLQEGINIKILEGSDEAIKKGMVAIRIYAMVDCKLLQPKHICKVTNIK